MKLRWSNIPIPEGHLALLAGGIIAHAFLPVKPLPNTWTGHALGWPLLVLGLVLAAWAVWAFQDMDFSKPTKVVTTGPYALSRNPMYLAWTLIYLGFAFIVNTLWLIFFLPLVLLITHLVIVSIEERRLQQTFGDDYRQYRKRVRRYL